MHRDHTVKAPWAFRILVAITILLAAELRLNAQDNSSKTGGFCFRVDDQHSSTVWPQYRDLFKKYSANFSFAANLGLTPLDVKMLQTLVADGNELMDHTPEHTTLYYSDPDAEKYRSAKGVDHYISGMNRVCLSIDRIDTLNSPGEILLNLKGGLGYAVSTNGIAKSVLDYPVLGIYSPERRMFFRLTSYKETAGSISAFTLWNAWNEPVFIGNIDSVRFRLIHVYDLHVSDEGLALLAERTLNLCTQNGLPGPTAWMQPGAPNPYLPADQVKRIWGDKYHFGIGSTFLQSALKCFNEVDPGSSRFAWNHDINLDSMSLGASKKVVADRTARHYVSVGLTHFMGTSQSSAPAEWQSQLDKTDSLLAWCIRKNIPVRTYRDWTRMLYDTPQNPYANIFPNLNTDLDEDGKPDGFSLASGEQGGMVDKKDGVTESGGVSYSAGTVGTICRVEGLGGVEKGVNAFSLSTRGSAGSVEVDFTLHSATDVVKKYVFPATTSQWKKYDTTLVIPGDVSLCDVRIQATKVGNAATKISGMFLAKAVVQITLTASAGSNGSITPSGVVPVIFGESKSFAFTPNNGYTVANVLVDSVSLGSVSSYTFANVTANHKISVTFRQLKKPVAVTAAATELTQTSVRFNGSVNPNGLATTYRFEFGLTSSYGVATPFLTAATGSALVSVYNPMSSLAPGTTYHYRISATNADGTAIGNDTLFTTFPTSVKVTASAGPNGKITPSGTVPVSFGGNQSFVISPNKGFRVATVLVDTSVVGTARSLQLSNVTKDQAVSVTFIPYSTTSVEQLGNDIPHEFALQQNYPNPFNPSTTINYSLPKSAFVVLQIFNALGQEVSSLVNEQLDAGTYQVTWNSSGAPSGIYFYRLQVRQMDGGEVGGFVETKRMILVK